MAKRKYVNGYMIYGCDDCGKGFKMYLEETLENGGPTQKPVPFVIQCPFCKSHNCKDVGFRKFKTDKMRLRPNMPAFIDDPNDDCGKPVNTERAVQEFFRKDQDVQR